MSDSNGTVVETESAVTLDSAFNDAWNTDEPVVDEAVEVAEDEPAEGDPDETPAETPATEGDEPEVADEDDSTETEGDEPADEDEDRFVAVVNGEEIEVTATELVNGYQRQADYTQKTQALAQEREQLAPYRALAEALADDPSAAVTAIAQHFGVQLGQQAEQPASSESDLDPSDPIEAELIALRQWKTEMESKFTSIEQEREQAAQATSQAEVFAEIDRIKTEHSDPDLDPNDLLQFAVENHIGNLGMAYVAMKATAKPLVPPTIRKIEAKRKAPPVEGGKHRAGVVDGVPDGSMSLEDALAAALSA